MKRNINWVAVGYISKIDMQVFYTQILSWWRQFIFQYLKNISKLIISIWQVTYNLSLYISCLREWNNKNFRSSLWILPVK